MRSKLSLEALEVETFAVTESAESNVSEDGGTVVNCSVVFCSQVDACLTWRCTGVD
ncbi:MAG TPA: hypothetical protein VE913_09565 [Longimicrobium sp.]|nr:hypothetical protein [Longimicrobium sp.]